MPSEKTRKRRLNRIKRLTQDSSKQSNVSKKDFWDKLGSITNLIASVVIALLGLYVNSAINERQHERDTILKEHQLTNEEIDIVSKFMVSLRGEKEEKIFALLAIQSLGKAKLATNLALSFPDSLILPALKRLAYSAGKEDLDIIANAIIYVGTLGDSIQSKMAYSIIEEVILGKIMLSQEELFCPNESLNLKNDYIQNQNSEIGKLIVDAMIFALAGPKPDLAMINSGAIRPNQIINDCITYSDIPNILPFGGKIIQVGISGKDLIKVFEHSEKNKGTTGFLQISNCKFDEKEQMWMINGNPVNRSRKYSVVLTEFLLLGREINLDFIPEITEREPFFRFPFKYDNLRTALILYLYKKSKERKVLNKE